MELVEDDIDGATERHVRHRKDLLRILLPDNVLVQVMHELTGIVSIFLSYRRGRCTSRGVASPDGRKLYASPGAPSSGSRGA